MKDKWKGLKATAAIIATTLLASIGFVYLIVASELKEYNPSRLVSKIGEKREDNFRRIKESKELELKVLNKAIGEDRIAEFKELSRLVRELGYEEVIYTDEKIRFYYDSAVGEYSFKITVGDRVQKVPEERVREYIREPKAEAE